MERLCCYSYSAIAGYQTYSRSCFRADRFFTKFIEAFPACTKRSSWNEKDCIWLHMRFYTCNMCEYKLGIQQARQVIRVMTFNFYSSVYAL